MSDENKEFIERGRLRAAERSRLNTSFENLSRVWHPVHDPPCRACGGDYHYAGRCSLWWNQPGYWASVSIHMDDRLAHFLATIR